MKSKLAFFLVGILTLSVLVGCAPAPLPEPELELEAVVNPQLFSGAGQTLEYTYAIKNVGDNTAVIDIHDSELGKVCGTLSLELSPGTTKTCHATYVTTAVDVSVGNVTTTVTAYAHAEDESNMSGPMSVSADTMATLSLPPPPDNPESQTYPEISLTISSMQACYVKVNEIITYTYSITNTGYKAIEGPFTIVDDRIDQWECPYVQGWVLDVGMTLDCTGYYKVRSWDVGSVISNLAHAEGQYNGQPILTNEVGLSMCFGGVNPTAKPDRPAATPTPHR